MLNLIKLLVDVVSHSLCRRIVIIHLRMFCLQFLQFVQEEVKVLIGDCRLVQHIITMVVLMELTA